MLHHPNGIRDQLIRTTVSENPASQILDRLIKLSDTPRKIEAVGPQPSARVADHDLSLRIGAFGLRVDEHAFGETQGRAVGEELVVVARSGQPRTRELDSAWDPRVLLTLETRMEHGNQQWCAAEAAEVPRRAA